MDRIEMSKQELERLRVIGEIGLGRLTQALGAAQLEMTTRQLRRLQRRWEVQGAVGLVSKRRGRPSNHCIDAVIRADVMARLRDHYSDFGPTLATEYLRQDGYALSKETLRNWMIGAGLWRATRGRRKALHPPRQRRSRVGELVQIDGSLHDWFEGRGPHCSLIAFIDDATSQVMHAHFAPVESTQAYLDGLQAYVKTHGRPAAFYSDRHGIFTKHDPEDAAPTQFQRATQALSIETIQALTPQAKGRVERLFQTLQDRLVKALRLAQISTRDDANAFLPTYLAQHNARFAVTAAESENAHLPYDGNAILLARICAHHEQRILSKDLVLSFRRQRYILQTGGRIRYDLRRQSVTVVSYPDGRIELLHGDEWLPFRVFDAEQAILLAVDDKTLNARVDNILHARKPGKPAVDHPWLRPFKPDSKAGQLAGL